MHQHGTIFTYHLRDGYQSQGIAYSLDKGRTWHKYNEGNPVILPPTDEPDFRDPKVFWYAPGGHWVMVLSVGPKVGFYTSPNLKHLTPHLRPHQPRTLRRRR